MSCDRANEIDVEAFLLGSDTPALEDFRAHYPDCPDCSARVGEWMALELALRDVLSTEAIPLSGQPSPEALEAYASGAPLIGTSREEIEMHLETSSIGRAELALLERFDPALGLQPHPARAAKVDPDPAGFGARLAGWMFGERAEGGLPVWAPAALAALLAAALFAGWQSFRGADPEETSMPGYVESLEREDAVQERTRDVLPPAPEPPSPSAAEALAENASEAAPVAEELVAAESGREREVRLDPAGTPEPLAEVVDEAPRTTRRPDLEPLVLAEAADATQPEAAAEAQGELLIAALTDLPLPRYAAPDAIPGSMSWMRQFGPTRAGGEVGAVEVRAPQGHVGLTAQASPRLWWNLPEAVDESLQVTIVGDGAVRPLIRVELPGPHRAGLHAFDLAERDVVLDPSRGYRWFVSVLVDPSRPSRNPVSAGALRRVDSSDARLGELDAETAGARGHALAKLGIWYDAFDFFASLAEAYPSRQIAASYRDALRADPE